MMTDTNYLDRRKTLEASFDGPIPRARLSEPEPPRKSEDAYRTMQQISERRRVLPAKKARTDETLMRLSRHLSWLVHHDRRR